MSYTYHELLGMEYPIYYCPLCEKRFRHTDFPAAHCPVCRLFDDLFALPPETCCHDGDEELVA